MPTVFDMNNSDWANPDVRKQLDDVKDGVTMSFSTSASSLNVGGRADDTTVDNIGRTGKYVGTYGLIEDSDVKITFSDEVDVASFTFQLGNGGNPDDTVTFTVPDGKGTGTPVTLKISEFTYNDYGTLVTPSDWKDVTEIAFTWNISMDGPVYLGIDTVTVSKLPPVIANVPTDINITKDTESNIDLSAITFSEPDDDTMTVALTASAGTFSTPADGGSNLSVSANGNGTIISLTGKSEAINSYLDTATNIKYTNATGASGDNAATITVVASDGVDDTQPSATINLDLPNTAPTITGAPTDLAFVRDVEGNIDLSGIVFNDPENQDITVTLMASTGVFNSEIDSKDDVVATRVSDTEITLVGSATAINTYLSTASNIKYTNGSSSPGDNVADITITASDGVSSSTPVKVNIDITNTAPVFGGLDGTPTFTKGGDPVVLDANVTITDTELDVLNNGEGNYGNATLSIKRAAASLTADDNLSIANGTNFTVNGTSLEANGESFGLFATSDGTFVILFNSKATSALVDEVLQSIRYSNTSDNPESSVTLDWTFNDRFTDSTGTNTTEVTINLSNPPTFSGLEGSTATFTEGGDPIQLDADVTIADVELDSQENGDGNYAGASFTITRNGSANANDSFSIVNGTKFTVDGNTLRMGQDQHGSAFGTISNSGGTLTVTFNADPSLPPSDVVDEVLQSVRYTNTSDAPEAEVTLDWTFNDGGTNSSGTNSTKVTITPENDAPQFSNLDNAPSFTEGGDAVVLDADVTVADPELDALNEGNGNYTGSSLTIARNGGENSDDSFSISLKGDGFKSEGNELRFQGQTFATHTNKDGTLTVNFSSENTTATSAFVNKVLQNIQYSNTSNNPPESVQLDWTFNDGASTSTGSNSTTVSITGENDAPTITGAPTDLSFSLGQEGNVDLSDVVFADPEGQNISVQLTASAPGFSTPANGTNAGVTINSSDDFTITFTGSASAIHSYLATPSNIKYTSPSSVLGDNLAEITVVASDGEASSETAKINVDVADAAPVLSGLDGSAASFTEGGDPVVLDADVTVTDAELDAAGGGNGNYEGASLTIARNGGASSNDAFSIQDGTGFTVSGNSLQADNQTFSSFTSNNSGTLTVNFGSSATSDLVDAVLQAIRYENTSNNPLASVQLDWTFNDGTSDSTGTNSTTVTIATENDAPVLVDGSFQIPTISEDAGDDDNSGDDGDDDATNNDNNPGATIADIVGENVISDPDGNPAKAIAITNVSNENGAWQYSLDAGTTWQAVGEVTDTSSLLLDSANMLRFVPNTNYQGFENFHVRAWDKSTGNAGEKVDTTVRGGNSAFSVGADLGFVIINAVEDAPTSDGNTVTISENTVHTFTEADFKFVDPDGDSLSSILISSINLPDGDTLLLDGNALVDNMTIDVSDISKLEYTPAANAFGTSRLSFEYTVSDGKADSETAIMKVDVNDVPVVIVTPSPEPEPEPEPISGGANPIVGGTNDDSLEGTDNNDELTGSDGQDTLSGGAGNDMLDGGNDNDIITAGTGDDTVEGGNGEDTLRGGEGADIVKAGDGNDLVFAGIGDTGDDQVEGAEGADTLGGGAGNDSVDGGSGDDLLWGRSGNDNLIGGDGNDVIYNGEGDDTVSGGSGADKLWASVGDDILSGGDGADTFIFGKKAGNDVITDFNQNEDTLNFTFTSFDSFADVQAAASVSTQNGQSGLLVDLGEGQSVFLNGLSLEDLSATNVLFA